jgi:hypothetical protein
MWEKIVLNLLSNAFKFTLAATIRVALRAATPRPDDRRDTGVGIPESERPTCSSGFTGGGRSGRTQEGSRHRARARSTSSSSWHRGRVHAGEYTGNRQTFTVRCRRKRHRGGRDAPGRIDGPPLQRDRAQAYVLEALRCLADGRTRIPCPVEREDVGSSVGEPRKAGAHVLLADYNADKREYRTRLLAHQCYVQRSRTARKPWPRSASVGRTWSSPTS